MFCDRCGAAVQPDQRFCGRCGKEFSASVIAYPAAGRVHEHIRLLGILWLALSALNAVAGFVQASRGTVAIDGRVVSKATSSVGIVFQNFALFPWFSALGNVEFPLKQFSLKRAERRRLALSALTEVGLAEHTQKYPGQLSGGMKQRVAIARTKVLLMDEPFGALDAQTRLSMQTLLLSLWDRRRSSVLFVTHDVDEALILADVVYVMSATPGRIIRRIDVDTPRPRAVDRLNQAFLDWRAEIIGLLRQQYSPEVS